MTPVAIARLILERITDAEEAATWVAVVLAESGGIGISQSAGRFGCLWAQACGSRHTSSFTSRIRSVMMDRMDADRLIVVRDAPTRDLVGLARDAAAVIRELPGYAPLADALDGAAASVAFELHREAQPV